MFKKRLFPGSIEYSIRHIPKKADSNSITATKIRNKILFSRENVIADIYSGLKCKKNYQHIMYPKQHKIEYQREYSCCCSNSCRNRQQFDLIQRFFGIYMLARLFFKIQNMTPP